ncbi:hypothetical protein [Vulcanisaeta souniana]|uniref:Uncharacterized protein n=2 Tax=Vulcanisaeta souniana TaxID=164452 RepID=A0A830EMX9_9CREN|nr:hypothetical protein [Vulcanisaeta souniana]BDR91193.1 hypothetical protein Vsou_02860 [Vulcanisaeta souniana JCM 11219]GGI86519.1 hypothetical protein GCM10007112_24370 [Vulcanisaeta souniana JCM 11219]
MGLARFLIAGFVGALLFLSLYFLVIWLQSSLIANPMFMGSLGLGSPFIIHVGCVGINPVPIIIDAVVLAVLALSLDSVGGLIRALKLTMTSSVIIASIASFAYSIVIHSLSGLVIYEVNSLTMLAALMIGVIAMMAICIMAKATECLRPSALALITYANALIIDYLVDALNSVTIATAKGLFRIHWRIP